MAKNVGTIKRIDPARDEDLQVIQDLLRSSELPWQDVGEHLRHFLVLRIDEQIVGTVGLEVKGNGALLRSLVVREDVRGQGWGKELYQSILEEARRIGVREVGLLTTTAEEFFATAGFERLPREQAPAFVTESLEFRELCSSSAVYMRKRL